eukprot:GFYU01027006.1.p1 GENE.GFYU01027006.1~~GFYU01027006.1.p1  ORF type:complete len:216 (+),score=50.44 GFYU01027006.1:42-650(+)
MRSTIVFAIALALAAVVAPAASVRFDMVGSSQKCFWEEVPENVLVLVDFEVFYPDAGSIAIEVLDPLKQVLFKKDQAAGTFAFTSSTSGDFYTCFENTDALQKGINFSLKTGVDAKDFSKVAKKDNLKPLEVELLKMEETVDEINDEMHYMRSREALMRNTNESTNARVLWFSLFSMVVLLGLGFWQIYHLKMFFQGKTHLA